MSGTVLGSGDAAEKQHSIPCFTEIPVGRAIETKNQALTMPCQKCDDGEGAKEVSLPRLGERKPSCTWFCPS